MRWPAKGRFSGTRNNFGPNRPNRYPFEYGKQAVHHFLTAPELSKANGRLFYGYPDVRQLNVFLDLSRQESQ
jgi:hypothetical protein